jgi:hypothetical protein
MSAAPAGISLFTQGGGGAYWDGDSAVLHLPAGAPSSAAAGVELTNPPTTLPSDAPTFTTSAYAAGSPRLAIGLSDGTYIFGFPIQYNNNWSIPGEGDSNDWAAVQHYLTDHSDLTINQVFVVLDTSGGTPVTAQISCLSYGGSTFGTC